MAELLVACVDAGMITLVWRVVIPELFAIFEVSA